MNSTDLKVLKAIRTRLTTPLRGLQNALDLEPAVLKRSLRNLVRECLVSTDAGTFFEQRYWITFRGILCADREEAFIPRGMKESWGWYGKAQQFLRRQGHHDPSPQTVELVALAMATERHGDQVVRIDENGTERTSVGTHCHGGRSHSDWYDRM